MGRLTHLIEAQQRENEPQAQQYILEPGKAYLAQVEALQKNIVSLAQAIEKIYLQINAIEMPDSRSDFDSVQQQIGSVSQAVQAIRIPEQLPFPKIPTPERVDLEPLLNRLGQIETRMSQPVEVMAPEPDKRKEWEFEVIRNNFGLIEKVVAKEV